MGNRSLGDLTEDRHLLPIPSEEAEEGTAQGVVVLGFFVIVGALPAGQFLSAGHASRASLATCVRLL